MLIETDGFSEGKINGEITEVVRDERVWRKMSYWFIIPFYSANANCRPPEFIRRSETEDLENTEEQQNRNESGDGIEGESHIGR